MAKSTSYLSPKKEEILSQRALVIPQIGDFPPILE